MNDVDIHNESVLEAMEGDFDSFLEQGDYEQCDAVIDNLRDLGKYEKGLELCRKLCKAKMMANVSTRKPMTRASVFEAQNEVIMNAVRKVVKEDNEGDVW